jgi:predicted nucleic acid-binding protein
MRVLIDTDVVLDVGLKRQQWFEASKGVLDRAEARSVQGFVAWHTMSNVYYLTRQVNADTADGFLRHLLSVVEVAPVGHADMEYALELEMSDLEDAMQAAAAVACRAARIVTRNARHYVRSPVPAVTPAALLKALDKA